MLLSHVRVPHLAAHAAYKKLRASSKLRLLRNLRKVSLNSGNAGPFSPVTSVTVADQALNIYQWVPALYILICSK